MADLNYQVEDGIGWITLNRPEARNALTFAMYEGVAEIARTVPVDGSMKALVLQGAGDKAFAAGTDMTQFRAFSRPQDALDYEGKMDRVLRDVEECPLPTIAAITGACTGGGAGIAAACDIRICDERLKFGFPIARTLGNCLSIGNLNRIGTLTGFGRLREILFTARLIEAEEARSIGLVSEVLPTADAVRERAKALALTLSGHAPLTLQATKESLRRLRTEGPDAEADDIIVKTYMSRDFKEGLEAFLGKRKPEWRGE